jgi:nucleoside-diphosphate-sugar epimerase
MWFKKGVRGRSSDNTLIRARLGWAPSTSLSEGMARTWTWVLAQVRQSRVQSESRVQPELRVQPAC